jgi:hypothetical protein
LAPGLTLIAAADVDADGRVELIIAHRRGGKEQWALYRALQTPRRLERVAWAPAYFSAHSQSAAPPAAPN